MKNFKVTYQTENANEVIVNGQTLDDVYRQIKTESGTAIHTANGRLTIAQIVSRAEKNGLNILSIEDCKKGKTLYGGATKKAEPSKTVEPVKEEPKTVEPSQLVDDEPVKEEPKAKLPELDKSNPFTPMIQMMVDYIKPYLDVDGIAQKIDGIVEERLGLVKAPIIVQTPSKNTVNVGMQHKNFKKLLSLANLRRNVLLVGETGSGKSHSSKAVADALELDYSSISVSGMTTKTDFFGYMDANGNLVRTPFRDRLEYGGVFTVDEMDAGNANLLIMLNMAISNGYCAFPDGMVKVHKDFVIVACANTFGNGASSEYVGRNILDKATKARFVKLEWNVDEELELAITPNKRWTKYVQAIRASIVKNREHLIASPRQSIDGGLMLADTTYKWSVEDVLESTITMDWSDTQKKRVLSGIEY